MGMIYNKAQLLKFLEEQLTDDDCILLSQELRSVTYSKRTADFISEFAFPNSAFKKLNDVMQIATSKNVGFIICDRDVLVQGVLDVIDGKADKFVCETPAARPVAKPAPKIKK